MGVQIPNTAPKTYPERISARSNIAALTGFFVVPVDPKSGCIGKRGNFMLKKSREYLCPMAGKEYSRNRETRRTMAAGQSAKEVTFQRGALTALRFFIFRSLHEERFRVRTKSPE